MPWRARALTDTAHLLSVSVSKAIDFLSVPLVDQSAVEVSSLRWVSARYVPRKSMAQELAPHGGRSYKLLAATTPTCPIRKLRVLLAATV